MADEENKNSVETEIDPSESEKVKGEVNSDNSSPEEVKNPVFTDLVPNPGESAKHNFDLLLDVTVPISVELGRTTMKIEDILQMVSGSVIELNTPADEAVEIKINGKLFAKGEIVVVEDNFGVRVSEIVDSSALAVVQ